ncbi:MAG: nicotinate-nucleotide pyrophosphorylase [Cenarchaeum symbiont of Oopsacas minuta]|nr:nicotinate-nucleotide pyrophosphorylase [Cenarchaeum symbiont of Oopsacas minuta]
MNSSVIAQLRQFLTEDVATGDITAALLDKRHIKAKIITRETAIISGALYAAKIFSIKGSKSRVLVQEGQRVKAGTAVVDVTGQARRILECERTALNLVSRMSGIATMTKKMISARGPAIYATRKTAPGLRFFDKKAVVAGGGHRHRMALDSSIMIKDNHLDSGYAIKDLVDIAKKRGHRKIQVEVEDVHSAVLAAKCGATAILLDNFTPRRSIAAVMALQKAGLRNKVTIEVSGGITTRNIKFFAKTRVDAISSGQITSSAPAIDLSLEVQS